MIGDRGVEVDRWMVSGEVENGTFEPGESFRDFAKDLINAGDRRVGLDPTSAIEDTHPTEHGAV